MVDKSLLLKKDIYLWGASYCGFAILHRLRKINIGPVAFLDSNSAINNTTHYGLRVQAPIDCLQKFRKNEALIVVCVRSNEPMTLCAEFGLCEGQDYIHYSELFGHSYKPLQTIPPSLHERFTMNGNIPVLEHYIDSSNPEPVFNSSSAYEKVFEQLKNRTMDYYGNHIEPFYDAFEKYPVRGKNVLIWGLDGCNCEAMSVYLGATNTIVVDYNLPICLHDKITVLSHHELAESSIKADIAISFSSFEHDGLGRYGDPINPDGDLEAMHNARKYLVPNGIMFLGVPLGSDCLCWNAHRIYGRKRLPLLLRDWNCIDVFHPYMKEIMRASLFDSIPGNYCQPLLVLQRDKINTIDLRVDNYKTEDREMRNLIDSIANSRNEG